ncbi:MAG: type I pantothenate kinase [Alphaproteobacteria bacterium]|nr:type I pantothenate kinase [Hyphomonas sp.]MBR9808044.1 type I pantothenate kinase [Alphaproteobacteria bacterium]|tara:strand:- start:3715 stop:4437 length:723 start_codon:yes stop_codon:yes gene_type:complete
MAARDGTEALARRLLELKRETDSLVAGLTGSVASGKTTLAGEIEIILDKTHRTETISTDGFLFSNAILEERGQTLRKGFPETYDLTAMGDALEALAAGESAFPVYSHVTYDVDPTLTRTISQPDILILEGLGFRPLSPPPRHEREPDILIYLDATEDNLQTWFLERFVRYWNAARQDPSSFYANFLHMSEPELLAFATSVWEQINLPNLREHIAPLRETADIIVLKDADHAIRITHDRIG